MNFNLILMQFTETSKKNEGTVGSLNNKYHDEYVHEYQKSLQIISSLF